MHGHFGLGHEPDFPTATGNVIRVKAKQLRFDVMHLNETTQINHLQLD